MIGVPVIGAVLLLVSWRVYRKWRYKPALKSYAAPLVVQPKEEPPIYDPPEDLKEVSTSPVCLISFIPCIAGFTNG